MFSYIRKAKNPDDFVVVVLNFKPVAYHQYRVGVPMEGEYVEILNSDRDYLPLSSQEGVTHGKPYFVEMTIPPFGAVILKYQAKPLKEDVLLDEKEDVEIVLEEDVININID